MYSTVVLSRDLERTATTHPQASSHWLPMRTSEIVTLERTATPLDVDMSHDLTTDTLLERFEV